jgi:hypothetical protein
MAVVGGKIRFGPAVFLEDVIIHVFLGPTTLLVIAVDRWLVPRDAALRMLMLVDATERMAELVKDYP